MSFVFATKAEVASFSINTATYPTPITLGSEEVV